MSRRCERPSCSAPATVAYGFAADRQLAWLADLGEDRTASGALCEAHAEAMVLPRGWWLDDRRTDEPTLFRAREHRPTATERRATGDEVRRRREPRRPHELVIGEQLALDAGVVPPAAADAADEMTELVDFDAVDDTAEVTDIDPADQADDGDRDPSAPDVTVEPWTPTFDVSDDLGGLLDASTPLLARAFGRRRSTTGPVDRG